ncbi:MAG: pyruvate dehydrogenase (acetyl-transferring) E1 component subunit alpha [Rhabdochlamydiaceae bacterium]|nr:pyruvate dehydrogenase (acetyl-transferring) E1 component subunit alpha [Rhabdochlamydiaceae bacterium]
MTSGNSNYHIAPADMKKLIQQIGKEKLIECFSQMCLIRNFETRAESAYQQGKIGGFFHAYIGQEAVQTAAVAVMGRDQWWATSYRCHALALLLDVNPKELMAELYGKATGNALGRGGSMHFFSERLLGGFGIVGGQVPISTGAAFTLKYAKQVPGIPVQKGDVSVCFMGDGAVVQGAFHESLNLAALWDLPCVYVIENNQWGMGTEVTRAVSVEAIAESKAPGYGMKGYTFDGMDFFQCYQGFEEAFQEVKRTSKPVLIEVLTSRFRGHSISDPGLYRTKEDLQGCMDKDPIKQMKQVLIDHSLLTVEECEAIDQKQKEIVVAAMKFAEESPWPHPIHLEEDVFAP